MIGCGHQRGRPCPVPGCSSGPAGALLVVCGLDGPRYFERAFVVRGEAVVFGWVEVEVAPAGRGREAVACGV